MKIIKYNRKSNNFDELRKAKAAIDQMALVKKQVLDYGEQIFEDVITVVPEFKGTIFTAAEVDDLFNDAQFWINEGLTLAFDGENGDEEYHVEITVYIEYDARRKEFFLTDEGAEVAIGRKGKNGDFWSFNLEEERWERNNTVRVRELFGDEINENLIMEILHACPNAGIEGLKKALEENRKILDLYNRVKDVASISIRMKENGTPQFLITAEQENLIGFEVFEQNGKYYLHNHLCMVDAEGKVITVEQKIVDAVSAEEAENIIRAICGEFRKEFTIVQLLNKNTVCFYSLEFNNSPFRECKKHFVKIDEKGNVTKFSGEDILNDTEKELMKIYMIKIEKTFEIITKQRDEKEI